MSDGPSTSRVPASYDYQLDQRRLGLATGVGIRGNATALPASSQHRSLMAPRAMIRSSDSTAGKIPRCSRATPASPHPGGAPRRLILACDLRPECLATESPPAWGARAELNPRVATATRPVRQSDDPLQGCYRKATTQPIRSEARSMFLAGRPSCARSHWQSSDQISEKARSNGPNGTQGAGERFFATNAPDRSINAAMTRPKMTNAAIEHPFENHTAANRTFPYFSAFFTA
jgi:hypothetical protein